MSECARRVVCYSGAGGSGGRHDGAGDLNYHPPRVYGEDEAMSFDCLPALSLVVGALFAGAPDTTV
jgi:hypothetical protein